MLVTVTTNRLERLIGGQLTYSVFPDVEPVQARLTAARFFHIFIELVVAFVSFLGISGKAVAITIIVRHTGGMKLGCLILILLAQDQYNLRNGTTDRHATAARVRRFLPRSFDELYYVTEGDAFIWRLDATGANTNNNKFPIYSIPRGHLNRITCLHTCEDVFRIGGNVVRGHNMTAAAEDGNQQQTCSGFDHAARIPNLERECKSIYNGLTLRNNAHAAAPLIVCNGS